MIWINGSIKGGFVVGSAHAVYDSGRPDRRSEDPLARDQSCLERRAQFLVMLFDRAGLAEPGGIPGQQGLSHHRRFGVARGEDNLEIGPFLPRRLSELDAAHASGHHDIGEEQIERLAIHDRERERRSVKAPRGRALAAAALAGRVEERKIGAEGGARGSGSGKPAAAGTVR